MKLPAGWPTKAMIEAAWSQLYTAHPDKRPHDPWENLTIALERALAAAPTSPEQSIKPCVEPYKSHQCLDCGQVIETPPAQEDEPVAWTGKGCGVITHKTKTRMIEDAKYGGEFAIAARTAERHDVPLYTHPASDELRKAAEEVCSRIESENSGWVPDDVVQLRTALGRKS